MDVYGNVQTHFPAVTVNGDVSALVCMLVALYGMTRQYRFADK